MGEHKITYITRFYSHMLDSRYLHSSSRSFDASERDQTIIKRTVVRGDVPRFACFESEHYAKREREIAADPA